MKSFGHQRMSTVTEYCCNQFNRRESAFQQPGVASWSASPQPTVLTEYAVVWQYNISVRWLLAVCGCLLPLLLKFESRDSCTNSYVEKSRHQKLHFLILDHLLLSMPHTSITKAQTSIPISVGFNTHLKSKIKHRNVSCVGPSHESGEW